MDALRSLLVCAAVLVAAALGACSGRDGVQSFASLAEDGGPGPGSSSEDATVAAPTSVYFEPASVTLVVNGSGPQTAKYTLKAVDASGAASMVTADSIQFDRPDLALVTQGEPVVATAPASASAPYGGTGTLHAVYRGKEATATLTVKAQVVDYGPGLSAMSPGVVALGGPGLPADPAAHLLYPYDKTVWPLGLTSPRLMWNAPQTGDVYHLRYAEKDYTFDGYYPLAALPAQMRLDQAAWDRITASNDARTAADPLAFALSRWDHATNAAYTVASLTWTVAPQSLRGAIYYWSASASVNQGVRNGHISRFRPGTGATPQVLNNGVCMGCHAVNAQGTVLVADVDDQNLGGVHTAPSVAPYDNMTGTRAWASFDITQPAAPRLVQSTEFGADVALTPDGKYLVFGGPAAAAGSKYLSLADLQGHVIATSGLDQVTGFAPGETNLEEPAFSPDGKLLAVVETQNGGDRDNVIPAGHEVIATLAFHESGRAFDAALHTVVDGNDAAFAATGGGLGYPSFTPDSAAIAFHAGHRSTGCVPFGSCDDATSDDGDLFLAAAGAGAPIRLAAADDAPDPADRSSSVEPTFSPELRGGYAWVVFTSMRRWGNQAWPSDVTAAGLVNGKRRLWVAAVDRGVGSADPSHPAIYLEGQEDTPNMRGFWALAPCIATPPGRGGGDAGGACTNGFDCCSGFCENGVCADTGTLVCVGLGDSCSTAADCCNSSAVACTNGMCTALVK
jgi:hypothetical protein